MTNHERTRTALAILALVWCAAGASCPRAGNPWSIEPTQRALPPAPTLDQVIEVVHRNNSRIQSFSATRAVLSGSGFPTLQANVAFERPRKLRLVAKSGVSAGPELDIGSNSDLFWFWLRRGEPPAVYFCRHDQFAESPARHAVPIEPDWLIEALGIVEFDPALPHQGPIPVGADRFEIRTIRETENGPVTKTTTIDAVHGWVVEQRLHDEQGRLVASAVATRHRRDPLTGLTMPEVVQINFPPAQLAMQLDLGAVQINRLPPGAEGLWTMPQYHGSPTIDLGDPNVRLVPLPGGSASAGRMPGIAAGNSASAPPRSWSPRIARFGESLP